MHPLPFLLPLTMFDNAQSQRHRPLHFVWHPDHSRLHHVVTLKDGLEQITGTVGRSCMPTGTQACMPAVKASPCHNHSCTLMGHHVVTHFRDEANIEATINSCLYTKTFFFNCIFTSNYCQELCLISASHSQVHSTSFFPNSLQTQCDLS